VTSRPSSRSGSVTRSRSRRSTGAVRATSWTSWSPCCRTRRPPTRNPRSRGSRSWGGRTWGKSSLFNRLVGEERSVVYEEAGTTRDAVDALVSWPDGPVRFVDTAGFRRPVQGPGRGVLQLPSFGTCDRARGRGAARARRIGWVHRRGQADRRPRHGGRSRPGRGRQQVGPDRGARPELQGADRAALPVRASAGPPHVSDEGHRRSPPPGRAVAGPRALEQQGAHGTGERGGRRRARPNSTAPGGIRYRYATQVAAGPPRFVLFGAGPPAPSYQRFLEGRLRRALHLEGVPIGIRFRPGRRSR
jgi:GTP-binding protein